MAQLLHSTESHISIFVKVLGLLSNLEPVVVVLL